MIKLTITIGMAGWLLAACGSSGLNAKAKIEIDMVTTQETPEGASGDETPLWLKMTVTKLQLTANGETEAKVLYDDATGTEYQLIDRRQQIFAGNLEDVKEKSYGGLTIDFASAIEAETPEKATLTGTLTSVTKSLDEVFTVEKAQTQRFLIKVKWKNLILEDFLSQPEVVITKE